jgi:hypothetical protein
VSELQKFCLRVTAMALGFGTLLYVALLFVNAMAVLSEDRFLARSAWAIFFFVMVMP